MFWRKQLGPGSIKKKKSENKYIKTLIDKNEQQ